MKRYESTAIPIAINQNGIIVLFLYPRPNCLIEPSVLYRNDGLITKDIM